MPSPSGSDALSQHAYSPMGRPVGGGPSGFGILTTDANQTNVHFESHASSNGNLGVSGGGQVHLETGAQINGEALVQSSTQMQYSGATITGGVTIDPTDVATAVTSAESLNQSDAGMAATISSPTVINFSQGQSATITGGPGVNVVDLAAVDMGQNASLTFTAPAGGSFVVNVSGELHIQQKAVIAATGGMTAGDVVFNFLGNQGIHLEQNSFMEATILAPACQNVHLEKNSIVGGSIVADGANLHLEQNSQVQDTLP
jgi:choice-of-anchor A domain-containing protein